MITRDQYVNAKAGEGLHNAYYRQFVTDAVKARVIQYIGLDAILASTEPYFNDIPLKKWDIMIGLSGRHIIAPLPGTSEALAAVGDAMCATTQTCIAKQAARMIREDHTGKLATTDRPTLRPV